MPILALTADATSQTERLCREAGMDGVLTKPIEASHLLATIEGVSISGTQVATTGTLKTASNAGVTPSEVVTPIAQHPRYGGQTAAERCWTMPPSRRWRSWAPGSDFFNDVIENFRSDVRRSSTTWRGATAREKRDLRAFRDHAHSLNSGAANLGAVRFCQTITALKDITTRDLQLNGNAYLEKLVSEFLKLEATFDRLLKEPVR